MLRYVLTLVLLAAGIPAFAENQPEDPELRHSVEQLRSSIGRWAVTTDFLDPEGAVGKTVEGTYEFSWVVPDRVVMGKSEIPELNQVSGFLLYVNEAKRKIEMVSVSGDGNLWIMTGPLGGEVRTTQEYETSTGGTRRLKFTRFNVTDDTFESKMEYTDDGGESWKPGNHQKFRRVPPGKP